MHCLNTYKPKFIDFNSINGILKFGCSKTKPVQKKRRKKMSSQISRWIKKQYGEVITGLEKQEVKGVHHPHPDSLGSRETFQFGGNHSVKTISGHRSRKRLNPQNLD
jgi:hypothetical protein